MTLKKNEPPLASGFDLNNNTNTILAYWDKDLVCRFVNNAVFNWFGLMPEHMINKTNLPDFLGPVYEHNLPHIEAALKGKTQVFNQMISVPSGKVLNARITYVPDFDEDNVKGIFMHVADVSHLNISDKPILDGRLKETHQSIEDIEQTLKASVLTGFPGISNLAKKHYISESKLKRDFKDKYGTTIFAYYRNLQMELADKYINTKRYNKSEMALLLNFSNPSNFSSCYKKYLKHKKANVEGANESYVTYQNFVNHAATAVAMFDINMHFIAVSPKWRQVYDLIGTELSGKSLNEVLPDIEEKFRVLQLDLLKGHVNNYANVFISQKAGRLGWIRLEIQPWYRNTDEVGGVLIFTEDITALKQTEEKDKQFFEILNKTSEIERIGTWYRDFKTNTVEWSKVTREILEVSNDYVVPDLETSLKFYKEGKSRDMVKRSLEDVFKKRSSFDIEVELISAKGNLKHVRVICYSEFDNGKCERISGIFHDIGKLIA